MYETFLSLISDITQGQNLGVGLKRSENCQFSRNDFKNWHVASQGQQLVLQILTKLSTSLLPVIPASVTPVTPLAPPLTQNGTIPTYLRFCSSQNLVNWELKLADPIDSSFFFFTFSHLISFDLLLFILFVYTGGTPYNIKCSKNTKWPHCL